MLGPMAAQIVRFSPAGDLLAVSSPDGRLALWSGAEGGPTRLEQQLVPSHHLEAAPTCLAWAPVMRPAAPRRKKKDRKKDEEGGGEGPDLVALGTRAGSVLLYSVRQGSLVTVLKQEAAGPVLSLAWSHAASIVYTAGEEGRVAEWSVAKQALLATFQAGPDPISCLALSPDDSTLVAGSRDIKIWHLASRALLKTLTGHAGPVSCLQVAAGRVWSAAEDERTVAVWRLEGEETRQVMALAVNEPVGQLDVQVAAAAEDGEAGVVTAAVVTAGGGLQLFTPRLEGRQGRKPVKPQRCLTVAEEREERGARVGRVPVLAARLLPGGLLALGHGTAVRPALERLEVAALEAAHCLVRPGVTQAVAGSQPDQFSKTVTPHRPEGGITFLAPGVSLPVGTGRLGKRRAAGGGRGAGGEEALPMEDRLALLSTGEAGGRTPPRTDTLAQLLAQGLHSGDQRILSSVLDRADPQLIDNTVRRIPAEAVVPLVQTLMHFIKGRGRVDASHAKWLRSVLALHTGYLVSVPECRDLLTPVYALLEARTQHYNQVLQLRGKLELLTKQTEAAAGDTEVDTEREPLLRYQDDSSDELEQVMDDLLVPASDDSDDEFSEEGGDETMETTRLDSDSEDCVEVPNGAAEADSEESGSD